MGTNYYLHQKPDCECCGRICEEHAADKNPPFKDYEDNYLDGWLDAANEWRG